MKKVIFFLAVIGALYGTVGGALVEIGTASIHSTHERMEKAGV